MFGFNKIKEAQKKAEEMREVLAAMEFEGESMNGMTKVTCNGAREILSIKVNESAYKVRPQEEVEHMIVQATNDALRMAEQANQEKLREIMPNIPGLNL
ncbi:YbaB/EbfC family nucleoid-associated protein [bacterium]|nr:YbaB/EbfC family nucleoid-associated protein [bacterium]